jgi:hypothetical protein
MSVDRVQRSLPIVTQKHSNGRTTVERCRPNVVIGSFVVDFSRWSYEIPRAVEKLRIKGIRDKSFVYLAGVCQAVLR